MKTIRPRLITFDVTGTLLKTGLEAHYTEIGTLHGLTMEPSKLAASFKTNMNKLAAEHPVFGKHTGLGWENWWRTIVYNVFKEQNVNPCEKALEKVADHLIECYGTDKCWHKYPDTVSILEYLKNHDVVLGVISNFDGRLESVLASTELRPYFSFVLSSYDLGSEKPDPTIFEEALKIARRYGPAVRPQEAVHIGDTYDKDYIGAKNANWNGILIARDTTKEAKAPAKDVFNTLDELRSHFDKVLAS